MIKCLFLVEGPYDKQRLSLLDSLFDSAQIEIIPFNCDMLTEKEYYENYRESITQILSKEKTFSIDDFDYFIQVCDLDGCFIDDDKIIENKTISKIKYYNDHIEAIDRELIISRNHIKIKNIDELLKDNKILLFYNSTNIDHAFDNVQNLTNKQKRKMAIDMYNKYKGNEKEFLIKLCNANRLKFTDYKQSWIEIKNGLNSLLSNSNLIFFIERFKDYLKDEIKIEYMRLMRMVLDNGH